VRRAGGARSLNPTARLVTFTGAGHAPHWEEPERFAALVADFASSVVHAHPNTRTRP
jgi:pimeloyl-ACP methyl ester carboxylesterase